MVTHCGRNEGPTQSNATGAGGAAAGESNGLISVVVPTYNEAANLPLLVALLVEAMAVCSREWELVVVDDASPDGTADVVRRLATVFERQGVRIALVARHAKLGLGSAYAAGLLAASGPWTVLMDADLSHHPKYIPTLLEVQATTTADVVCGTRYAARGGGVARWGLRRKLTSRGANLLAATLLGASGAASDLTGAFRLYRSSLLRQLLPAVRSRGYAFQMEVLLRAQASGAKIAEVPIVFVDRLYGTSKLGASEYLQFAQGLVRLFFEL